MVAWKADWLVVPTALRRAAWKVDSMVVHLEVKTVAKRAVR